VFGRAVRSLRRKFDRTKKEVNCAACRRAKKMPGAKPGEVQQGGEEDVQLSVIAFTDQIWFIF